MSLEEKTVGVIGGMGPAATAEFLNRLVAATPARDDRDHLHVIVDNNPKIPSRIKALIEGGGEDPAPVLVAMARGLVTAGADLLAMPCNTAHYYRPAIAEAVGVPVLDMIALSLADLDALRPGSAQVGVLASPALRRVRFFERRLRDAGFGVVFPDAAQEDSLLDIIKGVKAAADREALTKSYHDIARRLAEQGAGAFLIACTELSLLPPPEDDTPVVDTLDVLVRETIAAARA